MKVYLLTIEKLEKTKFDFCNKDIHFTSMKKLHDFMDDFFIVDYIELSKGAVYKRNRKIPDEYNVFYSSDERVYLPIEEIKVF